MSRDRSAAENEKLLSWPRFSARPVIDMPITEC